MQLPWPSLNQSWVSELSIKVPILLTTEAESSIDSADPWPMKAIIITDGDRQRPSGSRPSGLSPLQLLIRRNRIRREAKAVENYR